jgi:hypothetical protein
MRIILAVLIACLAASAEDISKDLLGSWKLDLSKSDWSHKPGGAPREATMTIGENGWEYISVDQVGKKSDLHFDMQANSISGNENIRVKYEATGNPCLSDMRVYHKATGKELERVVTAAVPGSNALVIYGSGVAADGKQWWDISYYTRSH